MQVAILMTTLSDPEPDLLNHVSGVLLGPVQIRLVEGRFARVQICLRRVDPFRALENLPESVQYKEDGDINVRSDEAIHGPWAEGIEPVEYNDYGEERKREPRRVWLKRRFEHQSVAVDSLRN